MRQEGESTKRRVGFFNSALGRDVGAACTHGNIIEAEEYKDEGYVGWEFHKMSAGSTQRRRDITHRLQLRCFPEVGTELL
jgi:hypothetical protein